MRALTAEVTATLATLAADRTAGAREIAGRVLNATAAALRGPAPAMEALAAVAAAVVPGQPTMAALLSGFDRLFRAAERGGREAALAEVDRQLGEQRRELAAIAENAVAVLAPFKSAAVLSWSSTVADVLDRAGSGIRLLIVAESRPGIEGRRAAQRAAGPGREVVFTTDAAFPPLAAGTDALLLGGDALTPRGLVNKTGSRAAAREMRAAGRPTYAFVEDLKILGAALAERLRVLPDPSAQVWDSPPAGVTVRNVAFELTPAALLTAVVTSAGAESPAVAVDRAGAEGLSPQWASVPPPVGGFAI